MFYINRMFWIFLFPLLLKGQEVKNQIDLKKLGRNQEVENSFLEQSLDSVMYAELVILKDSKLFDILQNINFNKYCKRKGENWYVDFGKRFIVVSKSRVENLQLKISKDKPLLITIIDSQVLFILNHPVDEIMEKTGYRFVLHNLSNQPILGEESSYWLFSKNSNELFHKRIMDCD